MSGHIVTDFKDLRKLIGQVTENKPAKTQYQQQAEKMGYRPEAEAKPKDDKGDRGIARGLGKKHAGEDDIKKAYMKLGRAAQGSVEYQKKLIQKQLAKMGFKTYSMFAFDNLFKFESNQMIAKWLINEVQLDPNMLRKDFPNVWATKDSKQYRILNTLIMRDGFTTLLKSYKKDKKGLVKDLEKMAKSMALQKRAGFGAKDMQYINKPKKGQSFWSQFDESIDEGKYLKYSDLLLAKSRAVDKYGPDSKQVQAINKDIKKEMQKLGIKEGAMSDLLIDIQQGATAKELAKSFKIPLSVAKDFLKDYYSSKKGSRKEEVIKEGTWAVPDTKDKMKSLNNLMKKPLIIKLLKDAKKAVNTLGKIIGDDTVHDQFYDMADSYRDGAGAMDARDAVVKFLEDWGYTVKNYQITHYPSQLDAGDVQERGNLKKPKKGKLLKLDNEPSRSQEVKEAFKKAKQSPFKLKSQQYPRAVAINTDGFGKRHATVEDIIAACDSFGMIIDKELQVEQIQKQLGKTGFITYNKSELQDVFEERETQRIILTLESTVDDQKPIEYTKNEITEAYIMGEEIEFLKPDGLKTAGPILKKGGNTFNVKDKFTGKSYTYKYIGETEVKTFDEIMTEGRFSSKLIKQAGGIAFDKRYYMGNMTGAIAAIEKLKKGLSDDPKVKEMLKIANEGVDEWVSKDGTRRRVKERDNRYNKKIKEWEDSTEARVIADGDKEEYEKFFNKALKKFGVSSPAELEGDKKKEFFDYIDKNWKGDHEEVEQDIHKSYKMDGRRKNFKEKMRKLGYIKGR